MYSIIQAILQAVFEILPISESAHSSAFHEFAGSADGTCSALTGVIHMAIAIGIFGASYNIFMKLGKEFFATFTDIAGKRIKGSEKRPARMFMYETLIAFAPMILWLIPFGKAGLLYTVLHRSSYNGTLLDEGVFMFITGGVIIATAKQISLSRNDKGITPQFALFSGFVLLFAIPVAGFSIIGVMFSMLILLGVSRRPALRFALVTAAPVYFVLGIVEMCIGTKIGFFSGLLAAVIGVVVSFVAVRVLRYMIKNKFFRYFGIYDAGVGFIFAVVGIFQLALR